MAWPTTAWVDGDLVTAGQLNAMPVMLANTTLGADTASITFSSIPQHYAHLLLLVYARTSFANTQDAVSLRFNSDSGGNYDIQYVQGSAATASATENFAQTSWGSNVVPGNTAAANLFGSSWTLIPHYANTANNKCMLGASAHKHGTATTNMRTLKLAGFWRSNSAITSIDLTSQLGGNLKSGSRATLYGLS